VTVTIKERSTDARSTVLELEGRLDLYAAADLNAALDRALREQSRRVVLDVRRVTDIDFSLIAIIVQTGRTLAQRHATLEVVCEDNEIGDLLLTAAGGADFEVSVGREPGD